jgi:hypothetical protein
MQLRTSSLHKMNDPKENQPWSFGGRNIDYQGSYPETYSHNTHIAHQYILGDEIKSSSQIICFVKDEPEKGYLNEIMWAHYSNNHKGVCFELDAELFLLENKGQLSDSVFEPVTYGRIEKPFLGWELQMDKDRNIGRFVKARYRDLFLTKSTYWERENEQRLIIFERDQKFLSIKESLTGIYFGLQMVDYYRPAIDRFIDAGQTTLYNLYYEDHMLKVMETDKDDYRPLITKKFVKKD